MPTEATFRFSTYLTLALACVTIGYAEHELLPEVAAFAGLAVVALGGLYFLETRVSLLSIPAANRLGLVIGLVFLGWAGYRIKRETETLELASMGWEMLGVAMFGPFVMMLIVAKVARAEKHAGDYWTLHGLALAGIGLSGALAQDAVCFVLIGVYLVAAVWSLTLFHLHCASGVVAPIPHGKGLREPGAVAVSSDAPGRRTGFWMAVLWTGLAAIVVIPLYLLTPRSDTPQSAFGKARIEIGYAADQMVDLNHTGALKTNSDPAFEVVATHPNGSPKTDLNPEQRWRGTVRRRYASGAWQPDGRHPGIAPTAATTPTWSSPRLGPGQFNLRFDVPSRLRTPFLADPVVWVPREPPPVATTEAGVHHGWIAVSDGSFFYDFGPRTRTPAFRYVQIYRAPAEANLSPPFQFSDPLLEETLSALSYNPVPRVKEYADQVLAEMIARGELPAQRDGPNGWRDDVTQLPKEEYHDAIARAFSFHLASTPTLTYTTELRRENATVDPVEDFLFYSKAGHCERFASALVLMLRSQGIPAVFVLGFKGCEHQGDGRYVVRQEHAHAWVEALVSRPGPPTRLGKPTRVYHWRSLDPTPGGSDANPNAGWFQQAGSWVQSRFDEYVRDYTPEQRRKALGAFIAWLGQPTTLGGIGAVAAVTFGAWFVLRRRHRVAPPEPAPVPEPTRWFGELAALLAAHGIVQSPGDTAREYAGAAAVELHQRPGCEPVAEVPLAWADAYYQDRFGGVPPSDARLAELEASLEALRRALVT